MDIRLALMTGVDLPFPEAGCSIHQPTLKEISMVGEEDFFKGIQYLCINTNMFEMSAKEAAQISNFKLFITVVIDKMNEAQKNTIYSALTLLFPDYKPTITVRAILLNNKDKKIMIDEGNFNALQNLIKEITCFKEESKEQDFNPANAKAKEIAEKLKAGRKKVATLKGTENVSVLSQYLSSLVVGMSSLSLEEGINLTLFQLYDLMERFSLYMSWKTDMQARMAGAKIEKQPENWMKNLH